MIGMLMTIAIIGILLVGPTFDNMLVAVLVYGGMVIATILAFVYGNRISEGIARALLGGSGGHSNQKTDPGKALIAERRYDEAIALYIKVIAKRKKDPAPRLKLADLYMKLRDYDNCIKYMEEAVRLAGGLDEEERCSRINRIADLYLKHKRDRASAIAVLELIPREHPRGKYAGYARERIAEIRKGTQRKS
jgi:tetratricopeptide (TPR) repeat protein